MRLSELVDCEVLDTRAMPTMEAIGQVYSKHSTAKPLLQLTNFSLTTKDIEAARLQALHLQAGVMIIDQFGISAYKK